MGKETKEDMMLLRTRVRPEKHPDIKEASLNIVCKRDTCARLNIEYLAKLKGCKCKVIIKAIHHHPTQKNYKPFIEPKEGTVGSTAFVNEFSLKLGSKVVIIHNIDTPDRLTNGQLGVLVGIIKTTKGEVGKPIGKLNKKNSGIQNRARYPGLAAKYPDCVFIERVTNQYSIRKRSGDVSSTASVIQFPIKLAFAITSHKIQGQTIPMPAKVALDIDSVFEDAQTHVILSRVQQLDQIFIVNQMDENKIRTSIIGLTETERLAKISINANPTPWHLESSGRVKVVSLNCLGLNAHFRDIEADRIV